MKFLVLMKSKCMVPPEMATALLDGSLAWGKRHLASRKLEQLWAFAGLPAGAGIANVNSAEELNQLIAECPLGAVSETEIYPLVDFDKGLTQNRDAALAMMKK